MPSMCRRKVRHPIQYLKEIGATVKPLELIKEIDRQMSIYSTDTNRSSVFDIAIWHTLEMYYTRPDEYDLVATSTKEDAFERILSDNWTVNFGKHFYGIDYEILDELVLDYLIDNHLVTRVSA